MIGEWQENYAPSLPFGFRSGPVERQPFTIRVQGERSESNEPCRRSDREHPQQICFHIHPLSQILFQLAIREFQPRIARSGSAATEILTADDPDNTDGKKRPTNSNHSPAFVRHEAFSLRQNHRLGITKCACWNFSSTRIRNCSDLLGLLVL